MAASRKYTVSYSGEPSRDVLEEYAKWSTLDVLENANRYPGPSGFFAFMTEKALDKYITLLPEPVYRAHRDGYIYVHKLPYSLYIPYCTGHSIARLLEKGLKTPTITARPAKHLDSFSDHVANYLITLQHYFSGAQAFSAVELYAGPFIKDEGREYRYVKQQVQRLVYNLNFPSRVGMQTPFTNFTVVLDAAKKMLEGDYAIKAGNKVAPLGEYLDEAKVFMIALADVLREGDSIGQPFTFPIPTLMTTSKMIFEEPELFETIFDTAARRGSFYWLNTRIVDPDAAYAMCLHENERIIIREGGKIRVASIGEIFDDFSGTVEVIEPNGTKWYKPSRELEVLAFDFETGIFSWRRITRFLVKNSRRAVRITLSDGRVFVVTHDHPIPIYNKNTKRIELRTAENLLRLKRPDLLKVPVIMHRVPGEYVKLAGEGIEIIVDEEFARFLGIYYGDGTLIRSKYNARKIKDPSNLRDGYYLAGVQFSLNKDETETINFIVNYAKRMGWPVRRWDDPRYPRVHYIAIQNAFLARLLWDNGVSPYSDEKRVPWFIYASPPSVRLSFLKGLLEADGYFRLNQKNKECAHWVLHIKNRALAEDVVLLASMTGVSAYIRRNMDGSDVVYFPANPDRSFEEDSTIKHWRSGSIAWVNIASVEEVLFDSEQRFIDIEVEGVHYFVHSLGVVTHNCCRLSIDKRELAYAYNNHAKGLGLGFSLKKDIEEFKEDMLKNIERQRFGGLWAMPDITGSINVTDVNLPRIAIEARGDDTKFWELYDDVLELVKLSEDWFRQRYTKLLKTYPNVYSMILEYLHEFPASHFNTIGIIGLPEAAAIYLQEPKLWTEGSRRDWLRATEVMKKMVEYAVIKAREWMKETGIPWNVEEVPGESAAAKLALKDAKKHPEILEYLSDPENPIYSTSIAPYYGSLELADRIEIESRVQRAFTGGVMMHIFIGEEPDPEALAKLTKRLTQTDLVYWSYTPAITVCRKCNKSFTGLYTQCPYCGSKEVDIWSRIIGYYRPLRNWNPYRRKEFWKRKHYGSDFA